MIKIERKTKETDIKVELELYGKGESKISTGVGFFDHMLESFSKHALVDLSVSCKGDTHIDDHHSVEDVGIAIGQALKSAIYPVSKVERFGSAAIVMDENCVECDLDLSNRPFLMYEIDIEGKVGTVDVELAEEVFRAIVFNSGLKDYSSMKCGIDKKQNI